MEIDLFLELSCFFDDSADVGNVISGSSAFSKTSLNIWKFTVHILLKPGLENFEHYFTSVWNDCNRVVVWAFFGMAFLCFSIDHIKSRSERGSGEWLGHFISWLSLCRMILSWLGTSAAAAAAKSLQSCPTLCDPIDSSPPGCPIPGILQARTLCIILWSWEKI